MSCGSNDAWVTFVNTSESVEDALILAKSLQHTKTSRPIIAICDQQLDQLKRRQLSSGFSEILEINCKTSNKNLDDEAIAKIHIWTLTNYNRCIYLKSTCLLLKNCDDLFGLNPFPIGDRIYENGNLASVYIVEPNERVFKEILSQQNSLIQSDMEPSGRFSGQIVTSTPILVPHAMETIINEGKSTKNDSPNDCFVPTQKNCNPDFSETVIQAYRAKMFKKVSADLSLLKECLISEIPTTDFKTLNESIAIVGMSCRFPGANTIEEFWNLMMNKSDEIKVVPGDRWTSEHSNAADDKSSNVKGGWLCCPIDAFDANFFGISAAELELVDPQQRILLEVIWEGIEDAAINPYSLRGTKTGIFNGQWRTDYQDLLIQSESEGDSFFRSYMGNSFGMSSSRPAHFLETTGPNICMESGCSSSMTAVGMAMQSLRLKTCNIAIASGTNLILKPFNVSSLKHLLAKDGHCKTFDEAADGFTRAEGCACLILKRLSDAVENGDKIYALLKGYGATQEGLSKSLGTPTVECEAEAMKIALADAKVLPSDVSFVECHGTGTALGDPIEINAIANVYSAKRQTVLMLGSVKTNIGHTESCSGIAGILKTVLSMRFETIPPLQKLNKLNRKLNLNSIPAIIPTEPVPWKKIIGKPRIAGVSSFGITGTDAHVIIEEAFSNEAIPIVKERNIQKEQVLTISAKSSEALNILLEKYKEYLEKDTTGLHDISFTANTGRAHFSNRIAVTGNNPLEIANKINSGLFEKSVVSTSENPKICFLFPGTGCQYHGMGKILYEHSYFFKTQVDICSDILLNDYDIDIKEALWGSNNSSIDDTISSQISIFVIEYSIAKLWEFWGVKPDCVIGHSLGELAAAAIAGILSLYDAIYLVAKRCQLIQKLPKGKMLVVKTNKKSVESAIKQFQISSPLKWIDMAAINSDEEITVGSTEETILQFEKFCKANNIKTSLLRAEHAFHSRAMFPFADEYMGFIEGVKFSKPKCKYISAVTGKNLEETITPEYWKRHAVDPVQFQSACQEAWNFGYSLFLEAGPHPICSGIVKYNAKNNSLQCFPTLHRKLNDWSLIVESIAKMYVAGFNFDWTNFYKFSKNKKEPLPHYPFQRKQYWFQKNDKKVMTNVEYSHPLLGSMLDTPSKEAVFQNIININSVQYLVDHKLEDHCIFPAAGYLEMALAAATKTFNSTQNQPNPQLTSTVIKNCVIRKPLELMFGKNIEMQTIINWNHQKQDFFEAEIAIYSRCITDSGKNKNWTCHSNASVLYKTSCRQVIEIVKFNKQDKGNLSSGFYERLSTLGYNFGKQFQSIRKYWKNGDELLAEIYNPEDTLKDSDYVCHPILLDSMLQAWILAQNSNVDSLWLPVEVVNFQLISNNTKDAVYIHASKTIENNRKVIKLLDKSYKTIAVMHEESFVKTSIINLKKALGRKKDSLLPMFVEKYRSKHFSISDSLRDLVLNDAGKKCMEQAISSFKKTTHVKKEKVLWDKVVSLGSLKALRELSLTSLNIGCPIQMDNIINDSAIKRQAIWLLKRCLAILEEDGYLCFVGSGVYTVVKEIPSENQLTAEINTIISQPHSLEIEWEGASTFFPNIASLLAGKLSALELMFSENYTKTFSAESLYEGEYMSQGNRLLEACLEHVLLSCFKINTSMSEREVKLLEIGGGTGCVTSNILQLVQKHDLKYQYTFTDISPALLSKASLKFKSYGEKLQYSMLNIENDPKIQGFYPFQYDVIIGTMVVHATASLTESCTNLRHLLKPSGILILLEMFKPERYLDLIFGYHDGFTKFKDFEDRPNHCSATDEKWTSILQKCGFASVSTFEMDAGSLGVIVAEASNVFSPIYKQPSTIQSVGTLMWVIFADESKLSENLTQKLYDSNRSVLTVRKGQSFQIEQNAKNMCATIRPESKKDISLLMEFIMQKLDVCTWEGLIYKWENSTLDCMDRDTVTRNYLYVLQSILTNTVKKIPRIYLLTNGQLQFDGSLMRNPTTSMLIGMSKSFKSENPKVVLKLIDVDIETNEDNVLHQNIFSELWTEHNEAQVVYRKNQRYVTRLVSSSVDFKFPALDLPQIGDYIITLPATKTLADLNVTTISIQEPTKNEVQIQVKSAGLNFQDVFNVLKPDSKFQNNNFIAADFSGIVIGIGENVKNCKLGYAVIGCNFRGGSCASVIAVPNLDIVLLPDELTFLEGATMPCAFATAYHCLKSVGRLRAHQTALIHTASGGVGLSAIQLAVDIGAIVIATAGSHRKRSYLRQLGIQHVFDSRTTDFKNQILSVTNNLGVDLVLNSLTGPGFKEASLDCCKSNASFIEMSKLNVWSKQEVKLKRPDVVYSIEDLSEPNPDRWSFLMQKLNYFLIEKRFKPLPYTSFDVVNIRDALSFLQNAKHIGKVVCNMPERLINVENTIWFKPLLFNNRSTYLITGGTRGIGLEVAKWMVENGANHLVLCSKSKPSGDNLEIIIKLKESGVNIFLKTTDVSNYQECKKLINAIGELNMPPLRGIMHAAGCLSDAAIPNQTWEKFEEAAKPKVYGSWNLHLLTVLQNMEFFVLFSSACAIFGIPGQSNHSASNSFLDSLAHYRRSLGLPATSINFGQWGETGIAKNFKVQGFTPFSTSKGILTLEHVMKSNATQVVAVTGPSDMWTSFFPWTKSYLQEIQVQQSKPNLLNIEKRAFGFDFWNKYKGCLEVNSQFQLICELISVCLRENLKMDENEKILPNQPFEEMGMDSLMIIEFRNTLCNSLDPHVSISGAELTENNNLDCLARKIHDLIFKINP